MKRLTSFIGLLLVAIIFTSCGTSREAIDVSTEASFFASQGYEVSFEDATPLDVVNGVIIYPVLQGGHSRHFCFAYFYAYANGHEHLSYRMVDEASAEYKLIIDMDDPDWYHEDQRVLLSDSTILTLEIGYIVGDTVWVK